ncbi:unnamed protein product [Cylicocyclus nassatus]|uniref:Uncharacterized protein n=1 Tax=Cylicocyclus nassatus TaxID=53992 RepID=A0AA36MEK7_CYLNA|nr:unnamed protein product [Cylicocyclus nassatus]
MLFSMLLVLPALVYGTTSSSDTFYGAKLTPVEGSEEGQIDRLVSRVSREHQSPKTTMGHMSRGISWPQHRCRRLGPEFTACSRRFSHEEVFCIRIGQMCDGTQECPYADDEDPTLCLFHRLSMDEMSRIRLAFSHIAEKSMHRKQSVIWTDEDGKKRNQNGEYIV